MCRDIPSREEASEAGSGSRAPARPPNTEHRTPSTVGWSGRRAFLAALGLSLLASFLGVFDHSLWTPDEPRDAEVGREMFESGDYVVPTLAGVPATKRGLYLLPLLAPLGATVGAWLAATARREHATPLDRGTQKLVVVLLAALLAAVYLKPSLLARYKPDLSALRASAATPVLLVLSAAAVVVVSLRVARSRGRDAAGLGPLVAWSALALFVLGGSLAFRTLDGFAPAPRQE